MYGVRIAFKDYRIPLGIEGSKWAGLKYFRRFSECRSGSARFKLMVRLVDDLSEYYVAPNLVERFFLYFADMGKIVTSSGVYEPRDYYNICLNGSDIRYNEWAGHDLSGVHIQDDYRREAVVGQTHEKREIIMYAKTIDRLSDRNAAVICWTKGSASSGRAKSSTSSAGRAKCRPARSRRPCARRKRRFRIGCGKTG